jgi:hypothetical protein
MIRPALHTILWCCLCIGLAGCQNAPTRAPKNFMTSAQPMAPMPVPGAQPIVDNPSVEADNQPVRDMPTAVRPFPIEPLGNQLLSQMQQALIGEPHPSERAVTVSLVGLRNLSSAQQAEFIAFRQRLANVLTLIGRDVNLRFTADDSIPADYEMHGAAYLTYRAGFDVWEVYPRITMTGAAWTVWQTAQPIMVLRFARPNQPQIVSIPNGTAAHTQQSATASVR